MMQTSYDAKKSLSNQLLGELGGVRARRVLLSEAELLALLSVHHDMPHDAMPSQHPIIPWRGIPYTVLCVRVVHVQLYM